jgi:hypothetical protein
MPSGESITFVQLDVAVGDAVKQERWGVPSRAIQKIGVMSKETFTSREKVKAIRAGFCLVHSDWAGGEA